MLRVCSDSPPLYCDESRRARTRIRTSAVIQIPDVFAPRPPALLALLALLSLSCSGARCTGGADASPVPAPMSAPSASPDAEPRGLARIEGAELQRAFIAWARTRRAEAEKAGVSTRLDVEAARSIEGTNATVRVRERIEPRRGSAAPQCREGLRSVSLRVGPRGADEVTDTLIGYDCCPGAPCPERPPGGLMFDYMRHRAASDLAGLQQLVDPAGEIVIETIAHNDSEVEETTERYRRDRLTMKAFGSVTVLSFDDIIECPAEFAADGTAICRAHGGGFEGSYRWQRRGAAAYLSVLHESGH